MKTDSITIGRDPALTLFVMRGIAERNERDARKKAIIKRIKSILTFQKP